MDDVKPCPSCGNDCIEYLLPLDDDFCKCQLCGQVFEYS